MLDFFLLNFFKYILSFSSPSSSRQRYVIRVSREECNDDDDSYGDSRRNQEEMSRLNV